MTEAEIIAKNKAILLKYIPSEVVDDVFDYLYSNKIHFKIVNNRKTKLGDYRWPQHQYRYHQITVNGGLNSYAFLFVLLHEMAHHATYLKYQTSVQPHGLEWQTMYRKLLLHYTSKRIFPADIEEGIYKYCSSLPLKATCEQMIMDCLRRYDPDYETSPQTLLKDLPINAIFSMADGRLFRSLEKRRTRYKCLSLSDGKLYLIHGSARVEAFDK